jgi:hypothetical protein
MAGALSFCRPLDSFVRFVTKGDDIGDEVDIELTYLAEKHYSNGETEPGPVAEGNAAAAGMNGDPSEEGSLKHTNGLDGAPALSSPLCF